MSWSEPDQTVDVTIDAPKLPSMSGVPFRHGLPGVAVKVGPGTSVLVGWENGDPARKFACLWQGDEQVTRMVLNGLQIFVGGTELAEPPVKAVTYLAAEAALLAALAAFISDPAVAALSPVKATAFATALETFGGAAASYAATNVLVK